MVHQVSMLWEVKPQKFETKHKSNKCVVSLFQILKSRIFKFQNYIIYMELIYLTYNGIKYIQVKLFQFSLNINNKNFIKFLNEIVTKYKNKIENK